MNRRLSLLACAVAVALTASQALAYQTAAAAVPTATTTQPAVASDSSPEADQALQELRVDAAGPLRVQRGTDGTVDSVSSTDGEAMVEARGTKGPARTAADQLSRYGEAFGIDGSESRAVVQDTIASSTGGSVVRANQVVDGVTVFAGQVVLSLDQDQGVVSVDAATTEAAQVPAPVVTEAKAERTALLTTAKSHRTPPGKLTVTGQGRRLYDPAIVHNFDPRGTRPVWQFEVTNGFDIRETVLVGTGHGEVALHYNDAPALDRIVCDNASAHTVPETDEVPACTAPARTESSGASGVTDVNDAFANLGATSDAYDALAGLDLTAIVGYGTPKKLMSTVRWCYSDAGDCPFDNAFWDGRQMVFGAGYAAADDVVGHELTHGYVERTAGLVPFHQSGAINESVADVIGEIVDHRNPASPADDSAWTVGEDLAGGQFVRSLKNPPLYNQPDKMTSAKYVTADVNEDTGAVHDNDGVGNKTAYLVSQGGTFNGQTIAGIDVGEPGLAKTGRLWLETIARLTSGAEYADLGRVLASTCDELVASATGSFTAANCTAVRKAALATELAKAPANAAAAAPEITSSCPAHYWHPELTLRDDDDVQTFDETSFGSLWQRTPDNDTPSWSNSGTSSWFGWDPDPTIGDPATSTAVLGPFIVPDNVTGGATATERKGSLLSFHHAYVFEWDDAVTGHPAEYYDGGQVVVQRWEGNDTWVTQSRLPWVNGPTKTIDGSATKGFGGDSHGYGSSAIDLTAVGGSIVRVLFTVRGDDFGSALGWFVDDIRLNTCAYRPPGEPRLTSTTASGNSVRFTWNPPYSLGSGVTSYRIYERSGTLSRTVPGTARSVTFTGLNTRYRRVFEIAAVNAFGEAGSARTVSVWPTSTTVSTSVAKVKKKKFFTVTGRVGTTGPPGSVVPGMPVVLQRRLAKTGWSNVAGGSVNSHGVKSWRVRQAKPTYYRVVARGFRDYFGSVSAARLVKKKR